MRQPILMLFFLSVAPFGGEMHPCEKRDSIGNEAGFPIEQPASAPLQDTHTNHPDPFLFIAEYGPLEWPSGARHVRSMLIYASGWTQYTEREDAGTVLTVREGPTDRFTPFEPWIDAWPPPARLPESDPETLQEDHPAYLSLSFVCPGEADRFWEGTEQDLPAPWRKTLTDTWKTMPALSSAEDQDVAAWLAAHRLSPETAREKIQAGVLEAIADEQLESSPLLKQSLNQPFRLLPIREGENPFSVLGWSGYTAGRSVVNLGWREQAYHVRTFMNGVR